MKSQSTLTGVSSHRSSASFRSAIALASAILASAAPIQAASVTWNAGGGADHDWVNGGFTNWGGVDPSGNDLVFGIGGTSTSPSTVTSVVNEDVSASSLLFQYNSTTANHVLQVNDGATLSLGGSTNVLSVGHLFEAAVTTTKAVITGNGTLDVAQDGGTFSVTNNYSGTGGPSMAELDMSGLSSFNINLGDTGSFNFGVSTLAAVVSQQTRSIVRLADENNLTGGTLRISAVLQNSQVSLGNADASVLSLGRVNTINVDKIQVGRGYTSSVNGLLNFDASVRSDASATIRGSDGVSAVDEFSIGVNEGGGTSNIQIGNVDFSGGVVDAKIDTLLIASSRIANSGYAVGSFTMDRGIVEVSDTIVGQHFSGSPNASPGTTVGSLNVAGGRFVTDTLSLGVRVSGSSSAVGNLNLSGNGEVVVNGNLVAGNGTGAVFGGYTGNIHLNGGSLTVHGNLTQTGPTAYTHSNIYITGGALDLTGHSISVENLVAEAGILKNVNSLLINGAASGLVKSGDGVLRLAGSNAFGGGITVNGGVVLLDEGALPDTGDVTLTAGGAIAYNTAGSVQDAIVASRINAGATGGIALTNTQGGESLDFSAGGANLTSAFLGALGDVKYTGDFNPGGSTYRLGGGTGNLDFASDITEAHSVIVGGGSGSVRLSGNNSYSGGTTVADGTLRLGDLSEIGSANNSLTLDAGTLEWISGSTSDVTVGRSVTIETGGGTFSVAGGNAVTLAGGIAGSGGLTVKGGGTVVLQGLNSYSGATTVTNGRLVADLATHSTGVLDSSSALTLGGGSVEVKGASSGASSQTVGALSLNANTANQVVINRNGGASTTLNVDSLNRGQGSTLNVNLASGGAATAVLHTNTAPTLTNGIVAYATVTDATGTGFATVDGSGNVVRNTTLTAFPATTMSSATNYIVTPATNRTLTANRSGNSLTIDASTSGGSLNLATFRLSLTSGGLLMTGANDYSITNGTLGANNQELIVHQTGSGTLFIGSVISGLAGSLTKAGSGVLALTGNSVYTGATSVNEGTLQVDGSLGSTAVSVNNAALSGSGSIGGNITLSGTSHLSSTGQLSLGGLLNVNSRGNTLNSGTVSVVGMTTIASGASLTNNGALTGIGGIRLDGLLNGGGRVDKSIFTTASGVISGNLTVNGTVSGAGSINPGNSPGLLTATEIDASQGLSFNFEFNSLNGINWSSLDNDVLRLTSGDNPFAQALDSTNTVSLYLSASVIADLTDGGVLIGGFYADSGDFVGSVENANYRAFYEDAAGSILYNGVTYSEYTLGAFGVSTVQNAHFAADGYITQFQFQVIPEPGTIALFSAGVIGLTMRAIRRKRA